MMSEMKMEQRATGPKKLMAVMGIPRGSGEKRKAFRRKAAERAGSSCCFRLSEWGRVAECCVLASSHRKEDMGSWCPCLKGCLRHRAHI